MMAVNYRYGFNGMEKDDEISGDGNAYTTEYRGYDPRTGRWKSLDPVNHPWQSSYAGLDNNPINGTDPDGAAFWHSKARRDAIQTKKEYVKNGYSNVKVRSWVGQDGHQRWATQGAYTDSDGVSVTSIKAYKEKNSVNTKAIEVSSNGLDGRMRISATQGQIKSWDDIGFQGTEITGLTTDLFDFDILSYKNDFNNTSDNGWKSWKLFNFSYLIGRNGDIKGNIWAGKVEGVPTLYGIPTDFKAGVKYNTNIFNPQDTKLEGYSGIGTPGTEFKATLNNTNEFIIQIGIQEDLNLAKIKMDKAKVGIKLDGHFQYNLKLQLNFLSDWNFQDLKLKFYSNFVEP
jgi:RHS repeat-associated protein